MIYPKITDFDNLRRYFKHLDKDSQVKEFLKVVSIPVAELEQMARKFGPLKRQQLIASNNSFDLWITFFLPFNKDIIPERKNSKEWHKLLNTHLTVKEIFTTKYQKFNHIKNQFHFKDGHIMEVKQLKPNFMVHNNSSEIACVISIRSKKVAYPSLGFDTKFQLHNFPGQNKDLQRKNSVY